MDSEERAARRRTFRKIFAAMHRAADGAVARFAPGGRVPARSGGTGHGQGAEPPLGNPASDGQVLSSTTAGVRSWIDNGLTAEQIQDMIASFLLVGPGLTKTYDDAANTLTIGLGAPIVYLTDGSGEYLVDADGAYLIEYE